MASKYITSYSAKNFVAGEVLVRDLGFEIAVWHLDLDRFVFVGFSSPSGLTFPAAMGDRDRPWQMVSSRHHCK